VYLARWSTLLLAALIASPALWHAFVSGDLDYATAATRYLIAIPVSAIMLAILRSVTARYGLLGAAPVAGSAERRRGEGPADGAERSA